jgi:hypothetical protein
MMSNQASDRFHDTCLSLTLAVPERLAGSDLDGDLEAPLGD